MDTKNKLDANPNTKRKSSQKLIYSTNNVDKSSFKHKIIN